MRRARREPPTHEATGPNQVWCWDVSYLPSGIRGLYFYLYLILDLYSRKMVGWEVHGQESGEHAAALLQAHGARRRVSRGRSVTWCCTPTTVRR